MYTPFTQLIVVVTTGVDDTASGHWLDMYVSQCRQSDLECEFRSAMAYRRAEAHWIHCSEDEQSAIASFFGWEESSGERFPFAERILDDYKASMDLASKLLNEDTSTVAS